MNASDDFNRANGALSGSTASDGVHTWTDRVGVWAIASNLADPDATVNAYTTLNTDCADADVEVVLATMSGANEMGIVFRWSDTSNYLYAGITTTTVRIRKLVAGSFSIVSSTSITAASGGTLRVHAVGDQVSVYHTPSGGSESLVIGPVSESHNQAATVHGLFASGSTNFKFDNFVVTDLGAGVGTKAPPPRRRRMRFYRWGPG